MKTYLVGGAVRDGLLGRPVRERDWVVVGATAAQMRAGGFRPVGRDFPVFLHPESGEEYALARTERKTGRGHADFECHAEPTVTLEEDLFRRDLTINAMAKDGERLVDPYGGRRDLTARVLRHVSPAFAEDPLRVFRVARLAAQLPEFRVAEETLALMASMRPELAALSAERVWKELEKALGASAPARFFAIVRELGGAHWFVRLDLPATAALYAERRFRNAATALAGIGWVNDAAATAATVAAVKAPRVPARAAAAMAEHGPALAAAQNKAATVEDDARLLNALKAIGAFRQGEMAELALAALEDCVGAPQPALRQLAAQLRALRVESPPGPAYGQALKKSRIAHIGKWRRAGARASSPA